MPGKKIYEKYDDVIKKDWLPKPDDEFGRKEKESRAVAPEHPQRKRGLEDDEVLQYEDTKEIIKKDPDWSKEAEQDDKPSAKKRKLGPGYKQQDKDDDDDDIQKLLAAAPRKNKRSRAEAGLPESTTGAKRKPGALSYQNTRDAEAIDFYLASKRPFSILAEECAKETQSEYHDKPYYPLPRITASDYIWVVQGARGTGKTTLFKNVYPKYLASQYPYGYIYAQTTHTGQFDDWFAPKSIVHGFQPGHLWKVIEIQKKKMKVNRRLVEHYLQFEDPMMLFNVPNPYTFVLFDDTIGGRLVHDSEIINDIGYFGRHFCLGMWVNTQHGHAIHPGFRANADIAGNFFSFRFNPFLRIRLSKHARLDSG